MSKTFIAYNGSYTTTAAPVKVTTGTSVKTMMQLQAALPGTGPTFKPIAWGVSMDGIAAATPVQCELIETGYVGATVTAYKMPQTTLSTTISSTSTTSVVSTSAANFPATASSYSYTIVLGGEQMLVTTLSTNTFTVTRGINGTAELSSILSGTTLTGLWGCPGDIQPYGDPAQWAWPSCLNLANCGFTSSGEGTATWSRMADLQMIDPALTPYTIQWPLGREFEVTPGAYLRLRVTAAAAVNLTCWIVFEQ